MVVMINFWGNLKATTPAPPSYLEAVGVAQNGSKVKIYEPSITDGSHFVRERNNEQNTFFMDDI